MKMIKTQVFFMKNKKKSQKVSRRKEAFFTRNLSN